MQKEITWEIHTDSYGNDLYTFDTWRILEDGRPISPWVPSEALNVGSEVDHYTKGRQINRIVRTRTEHTGEYNLIGRGFDGQAHHFIAIQCRCDKHEVLAA
jgi:hypothetical protein